MNPPVVGRLARDVTALVRVVTPGDFPGGIVVVAERVGGRVAGLSIGDGQGLAELYGRRDARHAVIVDVERVVGTATTPTVEHRVAVDVLALHEVAHALFGQSYTADATDDALANARTSVEAHTAAKAADQHDVGWAAAFMLLAQRAARFRLYGPRIVDAVRASVTHYGFPAADLERVCRGVDATASLAELLTAGGPAAALLELVLPGDDARRAAVVAAGVVLTGGREMDHGHGPTGLGAGGGRSQSAGHGGATG